MSSSKTTIRFQNSKVVQTVWDDYFSGYGKALPFTQSEKTIDRKVSTSLGFHSDGLGAVQTLQGFTVGDRQAGIGEETQVPWKLQSYRRGGR